jgi:hypothetical protein
MCGTYHKELKQKKWKIERKKKSRTTKVASATQNKLVPATRTRHLPHSYLLTH